MLASLKAQLKRLQAKVQVNRHNASDSILQAIRSDPIYVFRKAGFTPDDWQEQFLRSDESEYLILCARQMGKSLSAAAMAINTLVLAKPFSLILIFAPSLRQSQEFYEKIQMLYKAIDTPIPIMEESATRLRLVNGSRIVCLGDTESTVRGYSGPAMVIIDEASKVSDDLYKTIRPMLGISKGKLLALSTPFGKRGFFYDEWDKGEGWKKIRVTADQCPRYTSDFLKGERKKLGDR
jgi:hypothetical protein